MKPFLLFALLNFASTAFGQIRDNPKSHADAFSQKAGSLMESEADAVGLLKKKDLRVASLLLTDLISGNKISAIRLQHIEVNSLGRETKTATVDKDEVEDLLKSLKIIQQKMSAQATLETEVSYSCRGGLEVGCFTSDSRGLPWSLYIKLEKYDSNSYVFLDKDDIGQLIDLIQAAAAKL